MRFFLFLLCCCLSLGAAMAQSPAQEKAANALERSKVAAERARLEAGFQAEEAACKSRFAVNACLQEIRTRRSEAMADLRRQDILINEADRKARSADQIKKTEDKSNLERKQHRAEKEKKAQQETDRLAERSDQRGQSQAKSAADASANLEAAQTRQKNSQSKAGEAKTRDEQAAANVQNAKVRAEKAAQNLAERDKRLKDKTNSPRKPLPAP
jgi:transglutaminase/protease-like cytokinesis protein 3